MSLNEDIWVTGLGIVTPFGVGGRQVAERVGVSALASAEARTHGSGLSVRDFNPSEILGRKGLRLLSPGTVYFMAATRLALQDAGLSPEDPDPAPARGMVSGTMTANAAVVAEFDRTTLREGPAAVNPALFAQTVWNATSSQCAIRFGLEGLNTVVSTGANSGLDALITARGYLQREAAETLLAGGYEELTPFFTGLFEEGTDGGHSVFFSEGAAVLVMELASAARERSVSPMARILGGRSGFMPPEPGEGYGNFRNRLVQGACREAGITLANINQIWQVSGPQSQHAGRFTPESLDVASVNGLACVNVVDLFGFAGGLTGALAAVLAVTARRVSSEKAPSHELLLAEDGLGRVAVLVLDLL